MFYVQDETELADLAPVAKIAAQAVEPAVKFIELLIAEANKPDE